MRLGWLLAACVGCTLIVGDRRQNADMSGMPDLATGPDSGVGTCRQPIQGPVNGATMLPKMESLSIAAVGAGKFVLAYSNGSEMQASEFSTGQIGHDPAIEMQNGPQSIHSCSPSIGCKNARVAASSDDAVFVWMACLDGNTTVLKQVQKQGLQPGTPLLGSCKAGEVASSLAVAVVGTDALALTTCETEIRRVGNNLTDGMFSAAQAALEGSVSGRRNTYFGWVQDIGGGHFITSAQAVDPRTAGKGMTISFPEWQQTVNGFNFAVVESTPPVLLEAFTLGSGSQVLGTAIVDGAGMHAGDTINLAGGFLPHAPYGMAAGPDYFMIAYTSYDQATPRIRIQRVTNAGKLDGLPVDVGTPGVPAGAPSIAYDADSKRFGIAFTGPDTASSADPHGQFAVMACD